MKECDKEISGIIKEQHKLEHKLTENNLEKKRMENEVIFNCSCLHLRTCVLRNYLLILLF